MAEFWETPKLVRKVWLIVKGKRFWRWLEKFCPSTFIQHFEHCKSFRNIDSFALLYRQAKTAEFAPRLQKPSSFVVCRQPLLLLWHLTHVRIEKIFQKESKSYKEAKQPFYDHILGRIPFSTWIWNIWFLLSLNTLLQVALNGAYFQSCILLKHSGNYD